MKPVIRWESWETGGISRQIYFDNPQNYSDVASSRQLGGLGSTLINWHISHALFHQSDEEHSNPPSCHPWRETRGRDEWSLPTSYASYNNRQQAPVCCSPKACESISFSFVSWKSTNLDRYSKLQLCPPLAMEYSLQHGRLEIFGHPKSHPETPFHHALYQGRPMSIIYSRPGCRCVQCSSLQRAVKHTAPFPQTPKTWLMITQDLQPVLHQHHPAHNQPRPQRRQQRPPRPQPQPPRRARSREVVVVVRGGPVLRAHALHGGVGRRQLAARGQMAVDHDDGPDVLARLVVRRRVALATRGRGPVRVEALGVEDGLVDGWESDWKMSATNAFV